MQLAVAEPDAVGQRLSECGAKFTPIELRLPDELSKEDWAEIGRQLLRRDQVMQWWIGDWAAFGSGDERQTGWRKKGALKEFCDLNGFNYQSVADKSWVSSNIHLSLRRENLSWTHCREVAPLKPKEQRFWLEKAAKSDLSVSELRREIRLANGEFNALHSEGQSIELGTKHYDDLMSWLTRRPEEFWTENCKRIWLDRLKELWQFAQERLAT